jgi:hypothetical protein
MADIVDLEKEIAKLKKRLECGRVVFYTDLPAIGKTHVLYINEETGVMSIWNGSAYIPTS